MSGYDFTAVLDRIAEGAVAREAGRVLPYAEVQHLREAGFTRLRIPVEYGGFGATLPEFIEQVIALGRADSNLPQLLRGHFGFVEGRLVNHDERWLRRVAEGTVAGNAQSELGAIDDDRSADVFVPAAADGVRRLDDWNGFGQRLTGSGTTIFENVRIPAEDVEVFGNAQPPRTHVPAVFQLIHLATLAGIGRAAVEKVARLGAAASPADFDEADAAVYSAQGPVVKLVLDLVTELFEVGGSSAVTTRYALDRHWRNARTLASPNPLVYRYRSVGDHLLNGTSLAYFSKGDR